MSDKNPLVVIEKVENHNHYNVDIPELTHLLKKIIMTQAQLAQQLTDLKAQADKSKEEIVAAVQALQDAIANAGNTTPEVDAALQSLKDSVQGLDDLNADATPAG